MTNDVSGLQEVEEDGFVDCLMAVDGGDLIGGVLAGLVDGVLTREGDELNDVDDLVDGVVVAEEGDGLNYADDLVDGVVVAEEGDLSNYADDLVDGIVVAEEEDLKNYADVLVDGLFLAGLVDGVVAGEEGRRNDAVCLVEDFVSG